MVARVPPVVTCAGSPLLDTLSLHRCKLVEYTARWSRLEVWLTQ